MGVPTIGVIGVPSDSAGIAGGVARAPRVLREAGLIESLSGVCPTVDHGDVPLPRPTPGRDPATALIDPGMLAAVVNETATAVARARAAGHFPLVLGGDCSLLLGCVAGSDTAGVLFLDGHEDAYPPTASPTGEAADMELGFLLGRFPAPVTGIRTLPEGSVAVLGARDGHTLREEGVGSVREHLPFADDTEVRVDPERITARALAAIPRPVWFHLDLDVLSTEAMPAVDYLQPGGIGWLDLMGVTRVGLAAGPVGWDVTIYNPDLDGDGSVARRVVRFLAEAAELL